MLLAFFGDDFTGSTDALEQLVLGGVPAVLLTEPPATDALARHPNVRAVGVAGQSRAMTPDEMDAELPRAFAALAALAPRFVHYKVCSTFDSSPKIGSIGRAIDLGARALANRVTPLVVGAPALARYCVFGNLFARSGPDSPVDRLDRHPSMARHPTTPMDEADLRQHLARQTDRPVALVDVLAIERGVAAAAEELARANPGDVVLFDVLTNEHLTTIGQLLADLQEREGKPQFVVGSSGVEAALTRRWQSTGVVEAPGAPPRVEPVDRIVVISGSFSPVTKRQIAWAVERGFVEVPLDAARLLESRVAEAELSAIAHHVAAEHDRGRSVVVHVAGGAREGRIPAAASPGAGERRPTKLGVALGRILKEALQRSRVDRVVVAGGDTAGEAARALGVEALEMIGPLAPGAPLCRVRSGNPDVDGVEMALKGGQVGGEDFFGAVRRGSRGFAIDD
jgi:uncharacterized protein YgbK (DUF1537 family)